MYFCYRPCFLSFSSPSHWIYRAPWSQSKFEVLIVIVSDNQNPNLDPQSFWLDMASGMRCFLLSQYSPSCSSFFVFMFGSKETRYAFLFYYPFFFFLAFLDFMVLVSALIVYLIHVMNIFEPNLQTFRLLLLQRNVSVSMASTSTCICVSNWWQCVSDLCYGYMMLSMMMPPSRNPNFGKIVKGEWLQTPT